MAMKRNIPEEYLNSDLVCVNKFVTKYLDKILKKNI